MRIRKKDVLLVPIVIVSGKVLSFVFNALLGAYYGAGKISDAFIMAHSIPTIIFEGVATALVSCYIPIQRTLHYEAPEELEKYNSNMTSISVMIAVVVTVVYYLFHHQLNSIYARGFDEVSLGLMDQYAVILVWSIPIIGAYTILRAHLQLSDRKGLSSIGQIVSYSVLIITICLFYPKDQAMAWATVFGSILCFLFFWIGSYRTGFRYRFYFSLREKYIRTLLVMIMPIFFSTLASELASIIDKFFASQYSDGIITSMTYGYQLSFSIQGIVSSSMLIVVFPILSDRAAKLDYSGMNNVIYTGIAFISWVTLPLITGGMILSKQIISILFGHGNFVEEDVIVTATIFSGYLMGVVPMCFKHVIDRVFFSLKKTGFALGTTIATVASNIILDIFMSHIWGYMGLVLATGIAIIFGLLVSLMFLIRENNEFSLRNMINHIIKPLFVSVIMGCAVLAIRIALDNRGARDLFVAIVCFFAGAVIYLGEGLALFRSSIMDILGKFKR